MRLLKLFSAFLIGLLSVVMIVALPSGPSNIDVVSSSRFPIIGASNTSAIAGNVTELTFDANTVTSTWQGYYGNISGGIVLGDVNNNTLYDWNAASPNGEIYATADSATPAWNNIRCANSTEIDLEDATLGVNQLIDQDSVNRTFLNITTFNNFYVGAKNINSTQNCYALNLFNSSGVASTDFQELLLNDGSMMIYTALVKQDTLGFDNRNHDFEMLVGENGHNGDNTPTLYYFYIELG